MYKAFSKQRKRPKRKLKKENTKSSKIEDISVKTVKKWTKDPKKFIE